MPGSCGWFPLSREEIDTWVVAHHDDLPRALAEISQFPVPFRKAIARALPADARLALWAEHIRSYLAPDAGLSGEQRALVEDAVTALPLIFDEDRTKGMEHVRSLEERMRPLFTRRQAGEMFGTLGPPEPPGGLPLPADAGVGAPRG